MLFFLGALIARAGPAKKRASSSHVLAWRRAALEATSQRTFKHALPHAGADNAAGGVKVLDLKHITHDHRQLLVDRGAACSGESVLKRIVIWRIWPGRTQRAPNRGMEWHCCRAYLSASSFVGRCAYVSKGSGSGSDAWVCWRVGAALQTQDQDNEAFLRKFRARLDRCAAFSGGLGAAG